MAGAEVLALVEGRHTGTEHTTPTGHGSALHQGRYNNHEWNRFVTRWRGRTVEADRPPVGLMVTVWRLFDEAGVSSECTVCEHDGRWHLVVQRGHTIFSAERCGTDDAALERSSEIWQVLTRQGWTEPSH